MASDRGLHLLDTFAGEGRTAFTAAEVRAALDLSPQAASNLLTRLQRTGLVDRVSGGRYTIRPLGALGTAAVWDDIGSAVAAVFAGQPHRISFLTALDHHGLLVRPVRPIQVASAYRPRVAALSGRPLRIVHEAPDTILLGTEPLGPSRIASVARALLDTAARPRFTNGAAQLAEALAAVDVLPEMADLAARIAAWPAYRRIGSICATLALPASHNLEPPLWRSLIDLDPTTDRHEGWVDTTWGVAWPYPPTELAAVTTQ